MRLRRVPLLPALLLFAFAAPAFAASTWYDSYLDARDKHLPNKRYKEALANLQEAARLKPEPAVNEQTYGLDFIDYFPYYYQGLAYLGLGDYNSAIRMFNIEEQKGAIRKKPEYQQLTKRRQEAEVMQKGLDAADKARRLREEVDRLRREAADLYKAGKYDEALAKLYQAQKPAQEFLNDPATQADIQDRIQKIRDDQGRAAEAQARARRIERDLADGGRLLDEGNPTEAKLKFESVLTVDPQNQAALNGKRRAEGEILASTTKAIRDADLRQGRALFDAGRYEEALRPLADAAADPGATEAQLLLERARKYVEGMRLQKEKRVKIDALLGEADAFMEKRRFSDAWVRLEGALALDAGNVKAQQQLRRAEQLTGEEMVERLFPNQPPALTFLAPRVASALAAVASDRRGFDVVGVATDDRGLARVRFVLRGAVVSEQETVPDPKTGELPRNLQFQRTFELEPGRNELKVIALDSLGSSQEQTFEVTRTLQFYETKAFLPSAAGAAAALVGLGFVAQRSRRRRAVRRRFNPYIAGAPVLADGMFFGRQKLLARIMNVLHHNSLMITGERRIGKTTLLHHLKKALEHDERTEYQFFPVSTDLQGVPEAGFFHALMTDVVETVRPRPENLAALRFRSEHESYDGRDFSHDLQRVIEELKERTPKKVKLVLLIDEVDVLNEYSERVNQRLRSIFMKTFSEHLVAIMSGVGIKRVWKSEGSPWYNFFDEIELAAFTREEAEALVREPVEGIFRWQPEAVELILEHSSLKPYVIQKFCIHAVNRMLEEGRTTITAADVETVRDAVQFERPEDVDALASRASA